MIKTRQHFIDAQQRLLSRYGVAAKSRFVDVPSISGKAQVLVSGEGPSVVLISGIGTPSAMFAPLMAELNDFKLFAIDLPGYGLTDTTDEFADNLRDNVVRFLIEVVDALDVETPAFIANSLGSLCAMWLSLEQPNRVASMIHIGCPAIVFDTSAPLPMRLLSVKLLGRILTRLQSPSTKQVEQLSKTVNEYPLVPELTDLLVTTEQLPGFRHTFLSTLNRLIRLRGNRPEMSLGADKLAQIEQPTLLFWGKDDPFGTPKVGKQMVEAMPAAKLHIIDGGHAPWLKQAERIGPIATSFLHQINTQ